MAEMKIQEFLNTIKEDGIKKAQEEADNIIAQAKTKANSIIEDAKKEASDISQKCKEEQDLFVKQANDSIKQACSNSLISLKNELNTMIAKVITKKVSNDLQGDALISLIKEAIKERGNSSVIAELSDKSVSFARAKLASEIQNGLELKVNDSVKSGFRLVEKDGSSYYDFSSQELVEIIKPYLSSSIRKVLDK